MINMKKFFPVLLVLILLTCGCTGSTVKFKECKLEYDRIKEDQMTKLWIEIENTGEMEKDLQIVFDYPETITIEEKGEKVYGFNVTVAPEGATSGRSYFNVYGDYVKGQPSSPWDIEIIMFSQNELVDQTKLTLTVLPQE